ncbi:DNA damage-induced cell division inhibitor SosA [Staphylococcus pasteuri]|uniref:DNA damage-induced cell division inhibitor SosA n=1 Tax=Staphylococcus pasteuri TaxID=45972 RepID=UPI003F56FD0B
MLTKQTKTFLTYISVFLISCLIFIVFFLSVNQNEHSEQTYEMTDHEIHQNVNHNTNQSLNKQDDSEQNSGSVFASIN